LELKEIEKNRDRSEKRDIEKDGRRRRTFDVYFLRG
jgi:hypothetical protein